MDAEGSGGVRNVLRMAIKGFFDVKLFEFTDGLVKQNAPVEQFIDHYLHSLAKQHKEKVEK